MGRGERRGVRPEKRYRQFVISGWGDGGRAKEGRFCRDGASGPYRNEIIGPPKIDHQAGLVRYFAPISCLIASTVNDAYTVQLGVEIRRRPEIHPVAKRYAACLTYTHRENHTKDGAPPRSKGKRNDAPLSGAVKF